MSTVLIVGSIFGAVIGLFHAYGVYARRVGDFPERARQHPVRVRAWASYAALWTWVLWIIFGSYVLVLWLVSVPIWAVCQVVKSPRPRRAR